MTTYFGFALSDSMFESDCVIKRTKMQPYEVSLYLSGSEVVSCLNPSHHSTIDAMREKFGIDVAIPETPPRVTLMPGDALIVMGVRGLPRLTDRHEYTKAEIASAMFSFARYDVL